MASHQFISLFLQSILPLILLALGYWIGTARERKHYASIKLREDRLGSMAVVTFDEADNETPTDISSLTNTSFVTGSVVISVDYFKRFIAYLRNIFGGRVTSYETLLDRARREAVLRMKEAAPGATSIANMRVETSTLSGGRMLGSVEVHAYGTAMYYDSSVSTPSTSSPSTLGAPAVRPMTRKE